MWTPEYEAPVQGCERAPLHAWVQCYVTGGDDGIETFWYGSIMEAASIPEEPNNDSSSKKRQRRS